MLTELEIARIKPPPCRQEIPAGVIPGLYLVVQPTGNKSWAYRYHFGGVSRKLTLGPYPALSLDAARKAALAASSRVESGFDPARERAQHRARPGYRLRELTEAFARPLGGLSALSAVQLDNVRRAAELAVLAEHARTVALAGGDVDCVELASLDAAAARAACALTAPRRRPGRLSRAERLAARADPGLSPSRCIWQTAQPRGVRHDRPLAQIDGRRLPRSR